MNEVMPEIIDRLNAIQETLSSLVNRGIVKEFYSVAEVAGILGKADFTVREWCRLCRVNAEKRRTGRGNSHDWMISREELERIQSFGLLPKEDGYRDPLKPR